MSGAYTISSPTAQSWERRSQVVDHVIENATDVPAYSQIVNLADGQRFTLTGERLHIFDETQWTRMLNILVMCSLIIKRPASEQEALKLMLDSQLNELLQSLPKSHQDEVVNHAVRVLSGAATSSSFEGESDE